MIFLGNNQSQINIDMQTNRGFNVSTQRLDSLELLLIEHIKAQNTLGNPCHYLELGAGDGALFKKIYKSLESSNLIDLLPTPEEIKTLPHLKSSNFFTEKMFESIKKEDIKITPNIVVAQRSLHYLPFNQAKELLQKLIEICAPQTLFIITLSSLYSEHKIGYPDSEKLVEQRFSKLSPSNQEKHSIREPVCLYELADIEKLFSHKKVHYIQKGISDFGNLKISFVTE